MLPWVALPMALGGFVSGWLSARLTEYLQPPEEAQPIRGQSLLVRDPLVQGTLAVLWAAIPFIVQSQAQGSAQLQPTVEADLVRWLEVALVSVPLVQVAITDLRTSYVYSYMAGLGLVLGLAFGWQIHGSPWWLSAAGAAGAAIAFTVVYALGRLLYRGEEPMARGDITIAAMVGAGAAGCTLYALFYGVLFSGALALAVLVARRSRHVFMPYGPGLCLGGLAMLLFPC